MQPKRTAVLLWTCFSGLALSACEPKRVVTNLAPPSERLQCVGLSARPKIPAEYTIDWAKVSNARSVAEAVTLAKGEVATYRASVRNREGVIAGYILEIEGRLFACSNNAAWLREWYAKTAEQ
jgi:hypothetical protein